MLQTKKFSGLCHQILLASEFTSPQPGSTPNLGVFNAVLPAAERRRSPTASLAATPAQPLPTLRPARPCSEDSLFVLQIHFGFSYSSVSFLVVVYSFCKLLPVYLYFWSGIEKTKKRQTWQSGIFCDVSLLSWPKRTH